MLRQFRIAAALPAAALAIVITTAGCGIKGPLVLPPAKPVPAVAPAPEPAATTPSQSPAPLPAQGTAPAGERKP